MKQHNHMIIYGLKTLCTAALGLSLAMHGTIAMSQSTDQVSAAQIEWRVTDAEGEQVGVPVEGKTSIILFVKADQERSDAAMSQLNALLVDPAHKDMIQPILVVSGQDAAEGAKRIKDSGQWAGPVVIDHDYDASGQLSVRVWPTTEVIDPAGNRVAHMPGLRASYGKDLQAYVDYANGVIDKTALDERLESNGTIASTPDSVASRHLHMAERLLEKGQTDLALHELQQGLTIDPKDTQLILMMARVYVIKQNPTQAISQLDTITEGAAPTWRVQTLRGRALVELDRYDEAKVALDAALKVNPDPSEAYYYLGRVHEHAQEWEQAAVAYRNAYEHRSAKQ